MIWLLAAVVAALAALLPLLYSYAASALPEQLPSLTNKRICLLIAHPDDEAMFFSPTVLALTRPETGNHVKILCLSSGNADGLGETRKKELVKSGMTLGLRQEDDVFVVDSPDFPDSMTENWNATKISSLLCDAFAPHSKNGSPSSKNRRPSANIDVLITFDSTGVSSHPNHISLHAGARAFIAALLRGFDTSAYPSPVALYNLTSVSMLRKYASIFDIVPTLAMSWGQLGQGGADAQANGASENGGTSGDAKDAKNKQPRSLLFFNKLTGDAAYPTARKAMTDAHKSQMVWFRWGWIALSRYMVLNDLQLEEVEPAAEAS